MEPQATPTPPTPPIPTPTMPDSYDQSAPTSPTVNTPVPSTPEPIQPPDSKISQKLLIPSIILLVIAVVLVAFKLILTKKVITPPQPSPTASTQPTPSPTSDPTADWKTYTNNQYNYSLRIPQDWVINAEEKSPAQSKIDPGQKISKIKFNNETSSAEIFYEGDWDHGFEPWVFEKKETINLGGKDADYTILGLEGKSSKWHVISIESFNSFRIEANIDPGDSKTFDQILSTFKFSEAKSQNSENLTKEECSQQGGLWQKWGLLGQEYCQIPVSDGGKSCTDGSQCSLGYCIATNGTVPGKCQTYKATFGCIKYINNGVVDQKAFCSD